MSAGCNGGASVAIDGAPAKLVVGASLISLILTELAPFLIPIAALLDGLVVELSTECGKDPPPLPTWDASDLEIVALGLLAPTAQQTIGKVNDLILNWAWDKMCQCTGGATGPPLIAPAPPPGGSAPSGNSNQPCFVGNYSGIPPINPDSATQHDLDISQTTLSKDGRTRSGDVHSSSGTIYGIPTGTTQLTWQGFDPPTSGGPSTNGGLSYALWLFDSNGIAQSSTTIAPPNLGIGGTWTGSHPITTTNSYWLMIARHNDTAPNTILQDGRLQTNVWCGGSVPNGQEACCPPDPSLALGIQTIIQLLQKLGEPTTKAYTKGTTHVGLTGSGSLTIAGLFGVQIHLTTGVPTAIQFPGVPPYERSVGWVSVLTGDGMLDEARITREHQVWASALAPYGTTIGYQLNPGFSMDLTELLPASASQLR